jgi:hypothetical protein
MRLLAVLFALALTAQAATGRVIVVAADASGARIPGTSIALRSAAGERTATTGADGSATFDGLAPGRYAAVAALPGRERSSWRFSSRIRSPEDFTDSDPRTCFPFEKAACGSREQMLRGSRMA